MAPKQPTKTTQTTRVELPKWVDDAATSNYQFAQEIAAKPYNAYSGERVAGMPEDLTRAFEMFRENLGAGNTNFSAAEGLLGRVGQGTAGMDRSTYTNPFIDQVEDKALSALDRQRVEALMGNSDSARSAGAFGGSRHGVVDALTNARATEQAGSLSAGLRKEGFDTASGLMQGDLQSMLAAAGGQINTGNAKTQQVQSDFAGLLSSGGLQQQQRQKELDSDYGKFREAEDYDLERLNILLSSLGMSPYGKTENTQKITSGGGGTDFAQMGLGIFSLLLGLSDRDEKTDIRKVGKDKKTGLPLYSYRYKGDPKTYPKVVGPMAQDVEKMFPGSTGRTPDGKMTVPLGILAAVSNGA
jgi:hypothetical protein